MFKFSLKIEDETHSLTKEKGIPFNRLGELLQTLYEAIDPKSNIQCTLGQIRGNCYALDFFTEEKQYINNFVDVHKNIEEIPFKQLAGSQKEYAVTLRKVLGDRYYITAYDNQNKEIASIKNIDAPDQSLNTFHSLKTIYGVVSQLGAPTLNSHKKYIRVDGIGYNIKISKDQDIQLKHYYGTDKLRIKVKQKRSLHKGRIIDSELISFMPLSGATIIDSLNNEGYIDFDLIKNTKTMDEIVNKLYKRL